MQPPDGAVTPLACLEQLLEAYESVGAHEGVVYVSVPITSGRREFELMRELGCTRSELHSTHRQRWLEEVIRPNEETADIMTSQARATFPGRVVVDPSRVHVSTWSADEYDRLWTTLIETYAKVLVVTPGWAFSRGAWVEVNLALRLGIEVRDPWGRELGVGDLKAIVEEAERDLDAMGWDEAARRVLLPAFGAGPLAAPPEPAEPDPAAAAADVFAWLVAERRYQLHKFGTALDDEHTRAGLATDGWWWQQLTNYFHRAGVLSLDTVLGRQALAKFVATACGLLESAVRVYGPLPPPGVPSGEVVDGPTDG